LSSRREERLLWWLNWLCASSVDEVPVRTPGWV
jgi:hypothetical protein